MRTPLGRDSWGRILVGGDPAGWDPDGVDYYLSERTLVGRTLLHATPLERVLLGEGLAGRRSLLWRILLERTSRATRGAAPASHTYGEQIPDLLKTMPLFPPTMYEP